MRPPNEFEIIPRPAFEKPVWEWKSIFGHNFVVSDPAGVKRVLLDNVANYPKTEMETKMLGAIVGDGLLVSQGEKWKSHRRLMAPSFDFKSIVAYSPAMVEAADIFANAWAAKGAGLGRRHRRGDDASHAQGDLGHDVLGRQRASGANWSTVRCARWATRSTSASPTSCR